ncbi:hypothetical protein VNI00_006094 [Paramarasmius palmivorus]|uniref:Amino acid transporter transmembrane domain-containing protein n=1 Tax=Paramarasmius palmivorus TaxID=297713 RepID=A0AAW0D5J3_9AGAR
MAPSIKKKSSSSVLGSDDIERHDASTLEDSSEASVGAQIEREKDHEIKYRSCSWQKLGITAALLFSEYICLAILSFPWSFSILGLVPGIIVTLTVAATVLYTSLILWRYCLKHPDIRDVCDIGKKLFGGSELAYNVTAVFFILNNTFIQALHVLVGARLLNTLTNSSQCTVVFAVRTFSAVTMGIAVLLAIIFAGIQDHPFGYIAGDEPIVTVISLPGTTYVAGMSAFLNISYTFIGQITLPSFIAEMENPLDFPKALWAVTIAEMVVFSLCGALVYHWVGNQYMTSPGFGSLQEPYKKIAFSFAIPTIIFLGSLYSTVSARFVFFRLFKNSHHRHSNTVVGWSAWAGILAATWVVAFIIAEVIPFFSDMLSLMSSLFDGWFGFIFWAMAYLELNPGKKRWENTSKTIQTIINYFFILLGLYFLVAGTYVSIQSIIDSYHAQAVGVLASTSERPRVCGTEFTPVLQKRMNAGREIGKLNYDQRMDGSTTVQIYLHIISANETVEGGNIPDDKIATQIDVLNASFKPSGFSFVSKTLRTVNETWYFNATQLSKYETEMKAALRQGGKDALNVYIVGLTNEDILGWSTVPLELDFSVQNDGVIVHNSCFIGGSSTIFNEGKTLVHEVGHVRLLHFFRTPRLDYSKSETQWFGLYHPFDGGCAPGDYDYVADTPVEDWPKGLGGARLDVTLAPIFLDSILFVCVSLALCFAILMDLE